MSKLVVDINELEDLSLSNGSRFRFVGQLLDLDYVEGTMNIVIGSLPEFRRPEGNQKSLSAAIGSLAYESAFFRGKTVPQRGDAVSVWLVLYVLGGNKRWEVLNIASITIPELNRLGSFWTSSSGIEFRALSSSTGHGAINK